MLVIVEKRNSSDCNPQLAIDERDGRRLPTEEGRFVWLLFVKLYHGTYPCSTLTVYGKVVVFFCCIISSSINNTFSS